MAQHAKRRGRAVQHGGQDRWRIHARAMQQVADLDHILQRGQVLGRAAFHMAAIGVELPLQLRGQEADAAGEPGLLLQRHGGGHAPLERHQRAAMRRFRRQAGDQAARILRHALHQGAAQLLIRRGGQEIPMAEPGGDARARHFRRLRQRIGAERQPIRRQRPPAQPRRIGAQRAQVAQPGEAMRRRAPGGGTAIGPPILAAIGFRRAQRADGAQHLELAAQQAGAAGGIPGPEVAEGAGRRIRHLHRLQIGQEAAGAAQDGFHQPAPRIAAMAAA